MLDASDTIVAIASHPGPAARGIVRLSGPAALRIALAGFEGDASSPLPLRPVACVGRLRSPGLTSPLPATLLLWPGPRSYTGEPVAEVHTVGSPPLLRHLLDHALARGARLAERGEFTLRAFLSGRIDLAQSEAVLQVIEAGSAGQLDDALRRLAGGLVAPTRAVRDRLLDRLVEVEANLDFADESDVSPVVRSAMVVDLIADLGRLDTLRSLYRSRDRDGARPRVVLAGPPNAGKSRLFNALLGREAAIVSPVAGTTRDDLIAPLDCDDLTIDLVDTAGEDASTTGIESAAQARRSAQVVAADLVLRCVPAGPAIGPAVDPKSLVVVTKADLAAGPIDAIATSAATGEGLGALRSAIAARVREANSGASQGLGPEFRECLDRAARALGEAIGVASGPGGDELLAAELRGAIDALGKVVGVVVSEEILDRVFRRFCVGK